jgi:molybdopterin molybdotransferase
VISFDEAAALLREVARPLGAETVKLAAARGRTLAAPVVARVLAPPADVSAMDGYALRDADLAQLPARLPVVREIFAGFGEGAPLGPDACARIFTGAPVPAGADRVVIQEKVRREGGFALFDEPPGTARHIRRCGSDFRAGDTLLQAGALLGPRQLVAAAAADLDEVAVTRRPRLAVLSTGDELVRPGCARERPGSIPESLSIGVAALAQDWGGEFLSSTLLADRLADMEAAAAAALREADLVVVTGGASVGEKDFARRMFAGQGLELIFSKVSIKPGKPVWLGAAAGGLVLGLPGNPTSAMVTARLFLAPLLTGLLGRDPATALRWREGRLAAPLAPVGERETFARGAMDGGVVRIASNQDSSAQRTLAECDLLVRLSPGVEPLPAGAAVETLDF